MAQRTSNQPLFGVDTSKDNTAAAYRIVNMRYDERENSWINDRGLEPLFHNFGDSDFIQSQHIQPIRFARLFNLKNSENYFVIKRETTQSPTSNKAELIHLCGNVGNNSLPQEVKFAERTLPKLDEPDESIAQFGRQLFFVNGRDTPIRWGGRQQTLPAFFVSPTPAPFAYNVDVDYYASPGTINNGGSISLMTSSSLGLGLGICPVCPPRGQGPPPEPQRVLARYRWRMTFITDTGSESPLSDFTEAFWTNLSDTTNGRFSPFLFLPKGPPGTVARRIYRTINLLNLELAESDSQYFFVKQIDDNVTQNYIDITPDALLTFSAPGFENSVVIPSGWRYAASWNGRMFLANTEDRPTRIIYSEPGLPEQFRATSYFDGAVRSGGRITGLFPYYDVLLVFRETGIDVIRSGPDGSLTIGALVERVGTTATDTITSVEGVGVMFLSYDGVYQLSGGLYGGSSVSVKKISDGIAEEMRRINRAALPRAKAAYSSLEKEWWCQFASDDVDIPSRGIVYHTANQQWSYRHAPKELKNTTIEYDTFAIHDISTLPSGHFVLAPVPSGSLPPGQISPPDIVYSVYPQVWTGEWASGGKYGVTGSQEGVSTFNEMRIEKMESYYESGNLFPQDHTSFLSVELEVGTIGHNKVTLEYALNGLEDWKTGGTFACAQPDYFKSNQDMVVLAPATSNVAVLDQSLYAQELNTRVRVDIHTSAIESVRWRVRGTNRFSLKAARVSFNATSRRPLNKQ